MTKRYPAGLLFLLLLLPIGCGPSTPKGGTPTPHGGAVLELPDGKGFVEILKQPAPGKAGRSVLIVYVLDPDKNAISPAPTSATFKGRVTNDAPVALKPDASKPGALASDPINDRGELEGELIVNSATIPILIR